MRIPGLSLIFAALGSLMERPMRTILTMFGIVIGVAAVFLSLSIGEAAEENIRKNLDSVSARSMSIHPNWSGRSSRARPWRPFSENDVQQIQTLNGVFAATGGLNQQYKVVSETSDWDTDVRGIDLAHMRAKELKMSLGIPISDVDIDQKRAVAVIGSSAARSLFPNQDPVGQRVKIQNIPFRIIGMTEEKGGESWRGRDEDNFLLIPRTTGRARLFGDSRLVRGQVRSIDIVGETQDDLSRIEKDIDLIMRRSRGLSADDPPDFRIFNFSANRQAAASIMKTTNLILLLLGGISLFVGGVGVMNIMLATVTERTREVGLRKALGARRSDILVLFLTESVLLSAMAGLMGLGAGYGLSKYLSGMDNIDVLFTPSTAIWAFGSSFFIGVLFGSWPAYSASSLNPVEALRHE